MRRCSEMNKGPTPMERLCKSRQPATIYTTASTTKGNTFTGADQSYRRDLCHHIGYRPSSNRQPRCLYHRLTRFDVASPLNPIFMLGGAPEAHDVLSKTPRIEVPAPPKSLPRGVSDQG